jgi:hypothetical protein
MCALKLFTDSEKVYMCFLGVVRKKLRELFVFQKNTFYLAIIVVYLESLRQNSWIDCLWCKFYMLFFVLMHNVYLVMELYLLLNCSLGLLTIRDMYVILYLTVFFLQFEVPVEIVVGM